jgi:hypothetical protein
MSPAPQRFASAVLGTSPKARPEVSGIRVDGMQLRKPNGETLEISLSGPGQNLIQGRLPEQLTLVTSGQVLLRPGRAGGQRLRVQVVIDHLSQVGTAAVPTPEGLFQQETRVLLPTGQVPPRFLDCTVEVRSGPVGASLLLASTPLRLELITLEGFLELVDAGEAARPSGQTHLEYLASIRWLWQSPEANLGKLFKLLIRRQAEVPPYTGAPGDPPTRARRRERLLRFQKLQQDAELIDISHVLVGIEGMPRQKPDPSVGIPRVDLALTWSGDLGSVIAEYAWNKYIQSTKPPGWGLQQFTQEFASREDLLGDLDGVNLGAVYDETRSLADNLRSYYASAFARRYSTFIANTKDASNNPALRLEPGSVPPRLTTASATFVATETSIFAWAVLTVRLQRSFGVAGTLAVGAAIPGLEAILKANSPEVQQIARYFVDFLEKGLASEPP